MVHDRRSIVVSNKSVADSGLITADFHCSQLEQLPGTRVLTAWVCQSEVSASTGAK